MKYEKSSYICLIKKQTPMKNKPITKEESLLAVASCILFFCFLILVTLANNS